MELLSFSCLLILSLPNRKKNIECVLLLELDNFHFVYGNENVLLEYVIGTIGTFTQPGWKGYWAFHSPVEFIP